MDVAYHIELPNDVDANVQEAIDLQLAFQLEFDDPLPVERKKRDLSLRKK